jgi:hypothetical protein
MKGAMQEPAPEEEEPAPELEELTRSEYVELVRICMAGEHAQLLQEEFWGGITGVFRDESTEERMAGLAMRVFWKITHQDGYKRWRKSPLHVRPAARPAGAHGCH